ncbi:MAG: TAXI family TRAP transporter solute-binding subunit [Hyphomicrobium sp.]
MLRPAAEGFATLKGLVADKPEFDAGFVKGGLVGSMQGRLAVPRRRSGRTKQLGKLRSVGRLFYEPIWVFVRSDSEAQSLRDLKGKKVLTGTRESGTRRIAGQLLRANAIEVRNNPLVIEDDLDDDGKELLSGTADAAFLIQPADSDKIQKLLHVQGIR